MRKIISLLLLTTLIFGCTSSQKLLQQGNYDKAIHKAVKKLSKKPADFEEIATLDKAYRLANEQDNKHIEELKMTGQPDIWANISYIYDNMEFRQEEVRRLPSSVLSAIHFSYINYSKEKITAKKKGTEYYYAHAKQLLANNNRFDARDAYEELTKAKSLFPNYKDVETLLQQAQIKGTSHVLFTMQNETETLLPKGFQDELFKISLKDINTRFINYDTHPTPNRYYDYEIIVRLQKIFVSPEKIKEKEYKDSREVEDGWQYILDQNGNVMKDSLGNDIKIAKTKIIYCTIRETLMQKNTALTGRIDFIETNTNQIIKTEPINAEWFFNYSYAQAYGDINALSERSRDIIQNEPVPFPPSDVMILNTASILKDISRQIVYRNKRLFK